MKLATLIASLAVTGTSWAAAPLQWTDASAHIPQEGAIKCELRADTTLSAWRGQRVGLQALLTPDAVINGKTLRPRVKTSAKGLDAQARFMRYTLTTDFRACGDAPDLEPWSVNDIIDIDTVLTVESGRNYPLWVTVEVARNAAPNADALALELVDESTGKVVAEIPAVIKVQDKTLPEPTSPGYFHLNLWQQPYAISRYYSVEPWSKEHLALLEPYAKMLARAGQKTITAIMFYEPWGVQSNDKFAQMVETVKTKDGKWKYDYTIFDRYVEFMDRNGVGPIIECFSMIPWEMNFRYFDEATGDYKFVHTTTDTPEYTDLWGNFLAAFQNHLDKKGWTDRTVMAMDERGLEDIQRAIGIVDKYAPKLKVSLAGNYHKPLVDKLYTYSITQGEPWPTEALKSRREKGLATTYYTCCSSAAPNLFSNSEPADAAYLPAYCIATGTDGYLHWSFQNWTDDPLADTRFKLFAPGDTYFIYPDGRTSIRYERMVEGIELAEKIKALRALIAAKGDMQLMERFNAALLPLQMGVTNRNVTTADVVENLQNEISAISELL